MNNTMETENKLFKYQDNEYIYYYPSQEVMDVVKLLNPPNRIPQSNYRLLLHSTFAINTRTNQIIKNIYSIEEIVDSFIINKEEE